MDTYQVKKVVGKVNGLVTVPGSKSMTNRALLLGALSKGTSILRGVLFSDDSRHFLQCLVDLGFELEINEQEKIVTLTGLGGKIPKKKATIDVGSAGTAARFITAMLALSDGEYVIECSKQMEKRPMAELFRVLTGMGAEFIYLGEEGHLPVKVQGNGGVCQDIDMDISSSTQYLSAMLMVTPVTTSGIHIHITSGKKTGSYIGITMDMLKEFGVDVTFDGENYVVKGNQYPVLGDYYIEPDVSAACYFYALAAITGSRIGVKNVCYKSVQGDMKFLGVLEQMGCQVEETTDGIYVTGPEKGKLQGVDVNMNDFSDQALTLAAIAPYANSETIIRNVSHIKGQECDRIYAIVNELTKCGIQCESDDVDIHIQPGIVQGAEIETYEDHRVAMAFTIMGLGAEGVTILNPMCCRKTFENYYEVLEGLVKNDH